MRRTVKQFNISNVELFKTKLLSWSKQFQEVSWLDSNHHSDRYSNFEAVLAVDALTSMKTDYHQGFEKLQEYQTTIQDWLFGYLTYDLKNDVETLSSDNFDGLKFPDLYFFQPKKIIVIKKKGVALHYLAMVEDEMEEDISSIRSLAVAPEPQVSAVPIKLNFRMPKAQYLDRVQQVLEHIYRGDIYEVNFCQEIFAEDTSLDSIKTFKNLNGLSNAPFAAFFKHEEHHLLCTSPERYLKRQGTRIVSQPIKGTSGRSPQVEEDRRLLEKLKHDPKERAENVMIVDLVRNDLSKIAIKGSVKVDELCQVYSFQQVHQMISTVVAEVHPETNSVAVLKCTFPMGSMTGAPKHAAMKIIEALETVKRGLYSGAVGYFDPEGNFDFNVIIRSILYNSKKRYVSFSVGSAITSKSTPENEYEECLIKAKAMRDVLEH